jgi:GntR family transcriptional regulator
MSQPARRTTRSSAKPSGDHAPDQLGPDLAALAAFPAQEMPDRSARALSAKAPRYQQIAATLRARIESGDLAPGEALPSEAEMLELFDVSRITIRNAIKLLRAAGLITTEQGRPTRVRPGFGGTDADRFAFDPAIARTSDGSGFTTWDSQDWSTVEPDSHYRATIAHHARALNLAAAEPVFILERHLQHATGIQATHRLFVPFATAARNDALTRNPFHSPAAIYHILSEAGHDLYWSDRTAALMPTPDDVTTLNIPDGVPLFLHTRITYERDGRPLILEETRLPAEGTTIGSSPNVHSD